MRKIKSPQVYLLLIAILGVSFIIGCAAPGAEPTVPTVVSVSPANVATIVPINTKITATFSEAMAPLTITTATFGVAHGGTAVTGTVSYTGNTATFTPTSNLAGSTAYTITITTAAKTPGGIALANNYVWSFTTGTIPDVTPPTVGTLVPLPSATGVAINIQAISVTFSEAMDPATMTATNFTLKKGTTAVTGTVSYAGNTATFKPGADLVASTVYTATITTGAKDLAGNALAVAYVWTFTTGTAPDTTAPTVTATVPTSSATGIAIDGNITATFSEAIAPLTINTVTFTVKQGTTAVVGVVTSITSVAGITTATFNPASPLSNNTIYTATITIGAKDLAGNALAAAKVWTFTTIAALPTGPAPVLLHSAGNYVILAKSAISTVPPSAITGDIGISPAAETLMTGFSETLAGWYATSTQTGTSKMFSADMAPPTPDTMTTAISDMQTAYTDAAGRSTPDFLNLGAGNIGGKTLTAGLYTWGTTVTVPSNITISGGANDVWIFQISGDLTVSNSVIVTLGGSAQAKNIFWQVAGQATLGGSSQFKGIILSQTAITMGNLASLTGRAFAQTAVHLDASTVTTP